MKGPTQASRERAKAEGARLRDLDDAAFIQALTGGNPRFFDAIQKPKAPEPPATSTGSTE